jgi:signal transduction histidine kinase
MTEDNLRSARILIVDDDVSTLCLLRGVLQRLGFSNVVALDQARAFAAQFHVFQPDLIITDLLMPDVSGLQVLEMVRGICPRETQLPVLVLTADEAAQTRRKALAAGATDILVKPFDPSELFMRIRNALNARFLQLKLQDHNAALEKMVAGRTAELETALAELKESQRTVVQQERFRAFGEMAGGVVHDFNNALMTVIGYSELLLAEPDAMSDPQQVKDYLGAINTAGRDASHVVSRLRDFYRPREKGEQFVAVDINKIIEEAVKLAAPKWKTQSISLGKTINIALELERVPPVMGNEAELREVITNLVFNAVDALPKGGVITLRTRPDTRMVQFEVVDNGIGMSPEVRNRCLEPFFTTKGDRGTGLGLPMVFGIIKRHEGLLNIQSVPGEGTTLMIRLPVADEIGMRVETVERPTLMHSLSVLVVDNEPAVRDIVSRYLAADGHRVTTASSGAEAVQRFQGSDFDLLLTDHGMPGMTGLQLARFIRQMRANQPIVLLTGFTFDSDRLPPEINRVIRKPIAPEKLRAVLAEVVRSGQRAVAA